MRRTGIEVAVAVAVAGARAVAAVARSVALAHEISWLKRWLETHYCTY